MATYRCGSCGNLHGAPSANCGQCGYPGVVLVPDDAGELPPPPLGSTSEERMDAMKMAAEERKHLLVLEERRHEAEERRLAADQANRDRLVSAGIKVLEAFVKLLDRTPSLSLSVGAAPAVSTAAGSSQSRP